MWARWWLGSSPHSHVHTISVTHTASTPLKLFHVTLDQSNTPHNAPVLYPIIHHIGTKMCIRAAHLFSNAEYCGYGTGALWDLWDWFIASHPPTPLPLPTPHPVSKSRPSLNSLLHLHHLSCHWVSPRTCFLSSNSYSNSYSNFYSGPSATGSNPCLSFLGHCV